MELLLRTFALVLVLEGIMPFLGPSFWRNSMMRLSQMSDGQIRAVGLVAIIIGLVIFQGVTWVLG